MRERPLYIAAYDIRSPKRLRRALRLLKGHAAGRQKSVFELFLDPLEKRELMAAMADILDPDEDRFFLLRLRGRRHIHTLGIAVEPVDADYFYIG